MLLGVHVREGPGHGIAGHRLLVRQRLEQPTPDDLEAFVRTRWPPVGLNPAHCVLETVQGVLSPCAADFVVTRRDTDDEERLVGNLG